MTTEFKICGLTRPEDAAAAAAAGAAYVGVVFEPSSPRYIDAPHARDVLDGATGSGGAGGGGGGGAKRVGVFGKASAADVLRLAAETDLEVLQLHAPPDAATLAILRRDFSGRVWLVVRVGPAGFTEADTLAFARADGVVLDSISSRGLGGSGESFDWKGAAAMVASTRGKTPLVLAGGLNAENVQRAMRVLSPDVVDVSSGVERSPGIKDNALIVAFAAAVRHRG